MSNYPQSPYGSMNFPMPPQYAAPAPAPTHQGAPSDPRHAPLAADGFQYNTTLPGLNIQHPPYPPSVQPPYPQYWHQQQPYPAQNPYQPMPFPPPFIGHSGVPLPPPPPPAVGSFYPQQQTAPMNPQSAPAIQPQQTRLQQQPQQQQQQHQQLTAHPRKRYIGTSDIDKEDGELSEADGMSKSPAATAAIPAPVPRSVPQKQAEMRAAGKSGTNGGNRTAEPTKHRASELPRHSHQQPMQEPAPVDPFSRKREEAKQFVSILHKNGITYAQLLKEGLDAELLEGIYRELKLPLGFAAPRSSTSSATPSRQATNGSGINPVSSLKPPHSAVNRENSSNDGRFGNGAPRTSSQTTTAEITRAQVPAPLKTSVGTSAAVKSTPSPITRKDYVARLQAAKKGKAVQTKPTPTEKSPASPVTPAPLDHHQSSSTKANESRQALPHLQTGNPPPSGPITQNVSNTQTAQVFRLAEDFKNPLNTQVHQPVQGLPSAQTAASLNATQGSASSMTEAEKARKTALVRQKILALQAAKKTQRPATPNNSVPQRKIVESSLQVESVPGNLPARPSAQPTTFPEIPGLFMHGSPGKPIIAQQPLNPLVANGSPKSSVPTQRRRPVAADFDTEPKTASMGPGFTRPLGQSPHEHDDERMIIEVSDDESDGSSMDLDEGRDPPNAFTVDSPRPGQVAFPSLRNLPALSNFPSRPSSVRASSALSTPPVAPTPPNLSQQELAKKTEAIAELRKKIAEKERLRKEEAVAKAAAQSAPAPQDPVSTPEQRSSGISTPISNIVPQKRAADVQPMQATARLGSTPRVDSPDWKRQRRAEIESGLPSLDASLAMNAARMEQLRKELEQIEADNKRRMQDKQNLVKELEGLGIDTEGMPHEELQAKKDEIVQQMETEAASHVDAEPETKQTSRPIIIGAVRVEQPVATPESVESEEMSYGIKDKTSTQATVAEPTAMIPGPSGLSNSEPLLEEQAVSEDMDMSDNGSVHALQSDAVQSQDIKQSERDQNAHSPVAPLDTKNVTAMSNDDSPMDDAEDFYSPQPEPLPTAATGGHADHAATSPDDVTNISAQPVSHVPSEEGEVDMSESSSEEDEEAYEPEEPPPVPEDHIQAPAPVANTLDVLDAPSPGISSSSASSLSDDEEELYEPADIGPSAAVDEQDVVMSGSANVEGFADTEDLDARVDEPMSVSSEDSDSDSSEGSDSEVLQNKSISSSVVDPSSSTADALAPQQQFAAIPEAQVTVSESTSAVDRELVTSEFVPYESPLRIFKSYRFHPNYTQNVPGGLLSMTYSHQIDQMKPLCRYEQAGGICNDDRCKSQHFKDMAIPDNELLVQLGMANPGRTPAEREQYTEGLRLIIKELKQTNTQDVMLVAEQILQYRRRFLNDDSRFLNFALVDSISKPQPAQTETK